MKFLEPSIKYERQIISFRNEFINQGSSWDGTSDLKSFEDISKWLSEIEIFASPLTYPKEFCLIKQYLYIDDEETKIIGMIQKRDFLSQHMAKYGGHIGYSIVPSERKKGYGTRMLKEFLPYLKPIQKVLITCLSNNEASRKIILKNGGVYENTVFEPEEKIYYDRYWINNK